MVVLPELLAANETYAASFTKGDLPMPPARQVAILTCMDARIDPARALGLDEGDAHVIRNAGGLASEAIRSLAISQELLGTREIVVIHHTDCGMLTFTDDQIRQRLSESLGPDAAAAAAGITFQPFSDVARSVHDDLETIRASPLIRPGTPVTGFVYDVRTGRMNPVE